MQAETYAVFVIRLLIILGIPRAAGVPIGRPKTDGRVELYEKLRAANGKSPFKERGIEELRPNAHCPFQVFYQYDGIQIICDSLQMKNCTGDFARCKDISENCQQAYASVSYFDTSGKKGQRKVEVGCVYHPKAIGSSVEVTDTDQPRTVT
jgi:hypothetical protein